MKKNNSHITQDNIHSVNNHLKRQFTINRRRDRIAPFARFISFVMFLASSCLLVYGLGCQIETSMITFPFLSNLWNTYCSYIPILEMEWYSTILAILLTLYLPAIVTPYVIHLIACLFYHPKADFKELSGNECEQAQILADNHKIAVSYPKGISWLPSFDEGTMLMVFSITGTVIPCLCSLIIAIITTENKLEVGIQSTIVFAIIGLVLYFVSLPYWMFLFSLLDHIKDKYYSAIDKYWLANDPQEAARREEAQERSKADRRRREEDYISSMAKLYAQEKKENAEYLKRLHEWATDGDDPTPGSGDGV